MALRRVIEFHSRADGPAATWELQAAGWGLGADFGLVILRTAAGCSKLGLDRSPMVGSASLGLPQGIGNSQAFVACASAALSRSSAHAR